MTANRLITTWARGLQGSWSTPGQSVAATLGDYAGDYDVTGLTAAFVELIEAHLPDGVSLHSNGDVYGPADLDGDEVDLPAAVEAAEADFWSTAQRFDHTPA